MTIDFTLGPEQRERQLHARKVAGEVLGDVPAALTGLGTPEQRFAATRPFYRELVRAGLLRQQVPPPMGGTMTGLLDLALVAEELWAVDADVPLSLFSTGLGLMPLLMFGTPEQQERLLPPFLADDGEPLAALAFSEPGGSANFQSPYPGTGIQTVARRDGDEWVISGTKQFIPHATGWDGEGADLLAVAARTDLEAPPQESLAVFLVPRPERGLTVLGSMETVGHRGALVSRVRFDEVRVPAGNILGAPGDGIRILETAFSATAGLVGAFSVGLMRAAFQAVLDFARTERRGGAVPVIEHQNVGTLLADMKARLEACRYLTWKACDYFDKTGGRGTELSLATKVFASETAVQVVYDGMRAVGAEAYTTARPLAGLLQDVLAYPLFDGGNVGVRRPQLQRLFAQSGYDQLAAAEGRVPGE
ncbi:acyl-CoA dehydrogenase family protein [Streptomyces sp. NPDC057474]|uniref:acyl-CoA dehydrogenase family protein n=1 Tax=Streptomyces sp. NPDC057474 TaxID=3346144 RepID=UPI0036C3E7B5